MLPACEAPHAGASPARAGGNAAWARSLSLPRGPARAAGPQGSTAPARASSARPHRTGPEAARPETDRERGPAGALPACG